ncbi:unnamed protein product [Ectocarpus sp. 8 AP-2014]
MDSWQVERSGSMCPFATPAFLRWSKAILKFSLKNGLNRP